MSKRLPSITSDIPRDLRSFIDRLREMVSSNGNDRLLSVKELKDANVIGVDANGNVVSIAAETVVFGPPPAPTNVAAAPAIRNVIVTWDVPTYPTHAYAEVWGASTNDIGTAVLLGQTPGAVYTDALGPGATRYYWVRFVNTQFTAGAYNSIYGTSATTLPDLEHTMNVLAAAYGDTSEAPFFQLNSSQVINGVTIPAGTYIKTGFIYDGIITNAKIGNAAVDNAKIASLAVTEAKIANLAVTEAKIDSLAVTNAKIANLAVNGAKIANAAISLAKIDTATITNLSALSATLGAVSAGSITASDLSVGSSPAVSGNTMTGVGTRIYNDGKFAIGNPTSNIVFNGSNAYINGFTVSSAAAFMGGSEIIVPANSNSFTQTSGEAVLNNIEVTKSIFVLTSCTVGIQTTTYGNSTAPQASLSVCVVQYSTSSNNGGSWSGWSSLSYIYMKDLSDNSMSILATNRNFTMSGADVSTIDVPAGTTNVKFRNQFTATARLNRDYTGDATWAQITPGVPYAHVGMYFTDISTVAYQLKV